MALTNLRFSFNGTFQMKRISTALMSSFFSSSFHSVRVNSAPSSSCWNSQTTACMPSLMNMSRKACGSVSSRRCNSASCFW